MASRRFKNKAKRAIKKTHKAYIVIIVLMLAAGFAAGYFGVQSVVGGDTFALNGEKEVSVNAGETISYSDEGIKYISIGTDLSDKVEIRTNMQKGEDGKYTATAEVGTEYYIIYTAKEGRCEGMTLYRVFKVKEVGA